MNDRRLSDHLKDHYARQAPRANKLEQWLAQHNAVEQAGTRSFRNVPRGLAAAFALVAVMAAALAWRTLLVPDWATLAANEVALNHRKHLAPEFTASDYDTLRAAMSKLDFKLLTPQSVPEPGLRVTGARYCSIQGHLAAQIKLRDARGTEYTLYQTHAPANIDVTQDQHEAVIDAVHIRSWREDDIYFALALDAKP